MAVWTKPDTSSNYSTEYFTELNAKFDALAKLDYSAMTSGIPTNAIKWDATNSRFEIYNGSTWGALDAEYAINVTTFNGQVASYYTNASNLSSGTLPAARFDDTAHGSRSGGTLHSVATTGSAGFMSATDKQTLDNLSADPELSALAGLISAANKIPYFTGSGTASMLDFKDEDAMTSNSASALASQQSIKAYVDAQIAALDTGQLTAYEETAEQTITSAGSLSISHSLGTTPLLVQAVLVCKVADASYGVNDELIYNPATSAGSDYGLSIVPGASSVAVRYGSNASTLSVINKANGNLNAITASSWRLKLRLWA